LAMASAKTLNVHKAIHELCCYHAADVPLVIGKAAKQ
jgi:hypothetical protein